MDSYIFALLLIGWCAGMVSGIVIEFLVSWYARYSFKDSNVPTWKEMFIVERNINEK